MSQQAAHPTGTPTGTTSSPRSPRSRGDGDGWVSGGVVFAGVLMLCSGVLAVLQGIAAIAKDDVYGSVGNYVYELNLTGWGWIHVILGALVAVTGWGVLRGESWARFTGIFLASLSLVAQFLFLPYEPLWSLVMMAIDVFVIWALASQQETAGRKVA
ncbi:DUF7144 family membrane protein [Streptomyces pseudovenezuelae]|uniref:DUF7144 domain-containing protein n=1 Tax=Streptomyces pseudovenezuelae TaxID=67350 RepID=A0ABT6LAJ5_9ACTN|nr:hypothetical protein [Streptomyces pseudovenezuelae]MDH6213333.1 hypothetical protein [Streptomyces pseudovenezuelae]